MSRNRLMLLVATVAAVVVVIGGFFLGVQPQLDRAAAARSDAAAITKSNVTTRAELDRLREQAKALPEMQAALASLRASVPASSDTATLLTELNSAARSAGVTVSTVTIGDPQAYSPPAAPASTAQGDGSATASSGSTATPEPTPSATAAAPSVPKTTTNSAITSQNFSVIPVAVSVNGSFSQALAFVKGTQSAGRLYLIDSISSASQSGSTTDSSGAAADVPSWSFSGYVYVLTDTTDKS